MKRYTTIKTALAAAAITTAFVSLAGSASAQAYVQRSSTYNTRPPAYATRPAYSNPYTTGYGNYGYYNYYNNGYYNRPYRPSNWNKKDDYRKDKDPRERFRDLRHDSKYPNKNYSNDRYDQNHPYDSRYYNRNNR